MDKLGSGGPVLSMAEGRVGFFFVFFVFGSLGGSRRSVFRVWDCVCVASYLIGTENNSSP